MSKLDYFKAQVEATISPMYFIRMREANPEKIMLIDVRNGTPEKMGKKIVGAINIPLENIEERLSEIPRDKTIVVYCWQPWCNLGAHAAIILLENGYDVLELRGGIGAWKAMDLPLEDL